MEYLRAFLVGGAICALSQVLIDRTRLTPARILSSYVIIGLVLTALGLYQPLVDFGGAGATVPLFGFGYSMAKGVEAAVAQYGWTGAFTGGIAATAGGVAAAVGLSLVMSFFFQSRDPS